MTYDETASGEPLPASPTKRGATGKKRSTSFPAMPLNEAADVMKEAAKYGFHHSNEDFATYMGHSTTNSGAYRSKIAALRDWKLVVGQGESITMTETGRMIGVPTDEAAELRALRAAFMSSSVFTKLYAESSKGTPLDPQTLGSRAVHSHGVSPGAREKLVESFVSSAVHARLAEIDDNGRLVLISTDLDSEGPDTVGESPGDTSPGSPASTRIRTADAPVRSEGTPVIRQAWDIDQGTITFEVRTTSAIPAEAFPTIGAAIASLEELVRKLATPAESPSPEATGHDSGTAEERDDEE